jgi:hypothetical protein
MSHEVTTLPKGVRVLQSGGGLTMNYAQEQIFVQGHCLPSHSTNFIQMMTSSVFSPKSSAGQQQAHERLLQKCKLQDNALDQKLDELQPTIANGLSRLGSPKHVRNLGMS